MTSRDARRGRRRPRAATAQPDAPSQVGRRRPRRRRVPTRIGRAARTGWRRAAGRSGQHPQAVRRELVRAAGGGASPGGRGVAAGRRQPRAGPRARRCRPRRRSSRASGRCATRPWRVLARLGFPRLRRRRRAVRPGPARGGRRPIDADEPHRARWSRWCGPVTGRGRRAPAARPVSWWPRGLELMPAGRATSTRSSACRATPTGGDPAGLPEAGPAPTTLTSTRTPPPRTDSRRSPRRTTCSPIPEHAQALRRVRARLPPGARRRRPEDAGRGRRRRGRRCGRRRGRPRWPARTPGRGRRRFEPTSTRGHRSRGLFGGMFGGRGARSRGPMPGADQEAEARAHRRGGVPRGPTQRSPSPGPDGQRTLEVEHSGRGHRRAAHPAARAGRPGHRRGAAWRPVFRRAHRTAPALPASTARYLRRRCRWHRGRRRWVRRCRSTHRAARRKVQRATRARRAAGGCACAVSGLPNRRGRARGLLRRGSDHGAIAADTTRNDGCSRSSRERPTFDPRRQR